MTKTHVILTSFNHEKYIEESILSVMNQTFIDWDLTIVDDASTDMSWEIIQKYVGTNIKAIRSENNGEITSIIKNVISAIDTGDYIAVHHSDDVWEPTKLEKQVEVLDRNAEVGAVFTNARPINEDGTDLVDDGHFYFSVFDTPNRSRHEWLRHFFLVGNALCHPSAVIRKACFEQSGYHRPWLWQLDDFDLWIRFSMRHELYVIPERLTRFRVRAQTDEAQVSGRSLEARLRSAYELSQLIENYTLIDNFEDLCKIFPEARKYEREGEPDLNFVLGLVMLELATVPMARLFALDLIRAAVTDPERSENIRSLYHFGTAELVQLTGKYDVFSLEEVTVLRAMVEERDTEIQRLQAAPSRSTEQQVDTVVATDNHRPLRADLAPAASNCSIDVKEGNEPGLSLEQLRDAWDLRSRDPAGGDLLGTVSRPLREEADKNETIFVFALATQRLHGAIYERMGAASSLPLRINGTRFSIEINVYNSAVDLMRAIASVPDGYLVLSSRPELIWDQHVLDRVAIEIAHVEDAGLPWLCLCADGADQSGKPYVSAHFNLSPSLVPDRGRRLIAQTSGTLSVLKVAAYREMGFSIPACPELVGYLNALIVFGYDRGLGSFFTSNLYPCLREHQSLSYQPLESLLIAVGDRAVPSPADARTLFRNDVPRQAQFAAWINEIDASLAARHKLSFVIRTLFRRGHLLRRCLISIEYLRRRVDLPVEIVLATDIDVEGAEHELSTLREDFPNLVFVVARGAGKRGHSRVRNLVAGVAATTGTRVAIIDDDDYYTPQAVSCFQQACRFGAEAIVIFGAQVANEKWISASRKWHRELLSYGERFDAKNWTSTLRGGNSIPLCGVIHPGSFVRDVANEYRYDYDLSEDFIFHVLCFAHSKRPPIEEIDGVFAYQSHREGNDNVSTAADRTAWVADTGNGIYQLLFEQKHSFEVISTDATERARLLTRIEVLEAEIARARNGLAYGIANLVQMQIAAASRKEWISNLLRSPFRRKSRRG